MQYRTKQIIGWTGLFVFFMLSGSWLTLDFWHRAPDSLELKLGLIAGGLILSSMPFLFLPRTLKDKLLVIKKDAPDSQDQKRGEKLGQIGVVIGFLFFFGSQRMMSIFPAFGIMIGATLLALTSYFALFNYSKWHTRK